MTGDRFAAEPHPITGRSGWWDQLVGPGKPLDTERYFMPCVNVLGACMGTVGPREINPVTGKPYALDFPMVTVADMVRAQVMLLDHLGIEDVFSVTSGSSGDMQVLEWMASHPDRVFSALPIACAAHHRAQNIAFHEVGRQAILSDPEWRCGRQADGVMFSGGSSAGLVCQPAPSKTNAAGAPGATLRLVSWRCRLIASVLA